MPKRRLPLPSHVESKDNLYTECLTCRCSKSSDRQRVSSAAPVSSFDLRLKIYCRIATSGVCSLPRVSCKLARDQSFDFEYAILMARPRRNPAAKSKNGDRLSYWIIVQGTRNKHIGRSQNYQPDHVSTYRHILDHWCSSRPPVMAIKHLVSLGGSFAAGVGMPPWLNSSTMRSSQNYAHLVAQRTGARLTDMSAAGADTSNMMDTWQPSNSLNVLARERLPPQLTGVTEDTDLVTITAGRFLCRRNKVTTASSIL